MGWHQKGMTKKYLNISGCCSCSYVLIIKLELYYRLMLSNMKYLKVTKHEFNQTLINILLTIISYYLGNLGKNEIQRSFHV